ncbi:MAG: TcaA NTF2-like domain-containing protein [Clostridium sp.]|uniref:TcaA NTF2-like domain-containing protein n=1 Tax=Clostridium sp. TaxID=1506 RepID=UPI003D6D9BFB
MNKKLVSSLLIITMCLTSSVNVWGVTKKKPVIVAKKKPVIVTIKDSYVQQYVNTDKNFSNGIRYTGIKADSYFDGQSKEIKRSYYAYYNINSTIFNYNKSLSEAVKNKDFSIIQDYFNKDSNLYNKQNNLVGNFLNTDNEEFRSCMVLDYSYNAKRNLYKVNVIEKYNCMKEYNITSIKTYNRQYIIDGEYADKNIVDIQTKEVKVGNVLEQDGYINKVYEADGKKFLEVELVKIFVGDEAIKVAKEDGYIDESENSVDDDYYLKETHEVKTFQISDFAYFQDYRSVNSEEINYTNSIELDFYNFSERCNESRSVARIVTEKDIVQECMLPYMP